MQVQLIGMDSLMVQDLLSIGICACPGRTCEPGEHPHLEYEGAARSSVCLRRLVLADLRGIRRYVKPFPW